MWKISKSEAIRKAIEAGHAMPKDGVAFIKEQYGLVVSSQLFSSVKNALRGNDSIISPPAPAQPQGGELETAEVVTQVKGMVSKYGADQLKKLVDAIS